MFTKFFCLECEDTFQDPEGDEEKCPFCGSVDIMEDNDWSDGHFEGDMGHTKQDNSLGDD